MITLVITYVLQDSPRKELSAKKCTTQIQCDHSQCGYGY